MSLQRLTCEALSGEDLIHSCDPCGRELGRVRGVALIDPSYADLDKLLLLGGTQSEVNQAVSAFTAGISSGKIHLISETNGTYDGGSPQTGEGFGDEETRLLGYLYTLNFKDPSYAGNKDFWQRAEREHWILLWRTETLVHITDKPAGIQAIDPVESDLTSGVTWQVTATWKSKNKPEILPLAPIEQYFEGCWEDN